MSLWRGFSDFPAGLDEPDEEILGHPTCEACGWVGPPLTQSCELQDPENWQHTCRSVMDKISSVRIPQEHELTIEPTLAEWLS